jgi:hypothetical protein
LLFFSNIILHGNHYIKIITWRAQWLTLPNYMGGEERTIIVQEQPVQKVRKTLSQRTSFACWLLSIIPARWEVEVRRIMA